MHKKEHSFSYFNTMKIMHNKGKLDRLSQSACMVEAKDIK